jgi:hypothetical protein
VSNYYGDGIKYDPRGQDLVSIIVVAKFGKNVTLADGSDKIRNGILNDYARTYCLVLVT